MKLEGSIIFRTSGVAQSDFVLPPISLKFWEFFSLGVAILFCWLPKEHTGGALMLRCYNRGGTLIFGLSGIWCGATHPCVLVKDFVDHILTSPHVDEARMKSCGGVRIRNPMVTVKSFFLAKNKFKWYHTQYKHLWTTLWQFPDRCFSAVFMYVWAAYTLMWMQNDARNKNKKL